jgi:glycosyltransferase involved in cell wall biosynthesis
LLEAMCCGAFPIQSNPGNATAEIVTHASNGLLIEDCENSEEIKGHVIYAINQPELIKEAYIYNQSYAKEYLSREIVTKRALEIYQSIEPNNATR